jgi:hypothetical protein
MALIVCTPGGASDNCYVTLAQANAYYANTLRQADWAAHASAQQERALIQATAEIEALGGPKSAEDDATRPLFTGTPYDRDAQALHFPRTVDVADDSSLYVPPAIREAVIEQAMWLLDRQANPDVLDRDELQAQGVRSISIEGHSEQYGDSPRPYGICTRAAGLVGLFTKASGLGRTHARARR